MSDQRVFGSFEFRDTPRIVLLVILGVIIAVAARQATQETAAQNVTVTRPVTTIPVSQQPLQPTHPAQERR